MKILVICQYYYPEPFRITDICETLVSKGHEVTVVTGTPNYPMGEVYSGYENGKKMDETFNGVKIHRCISVPRKKGSINRLRNYFSYASASKKYIKKLKDEYDLVFVNQLSPVMMAEAGILYKKKFNKKLILYCLDLWPDSLRVGGISNKSIIYKFFKVVSAKIYNSADEILVTSKMFIDHLNSSLRIDKSKIKYLPQYSESQFLNLKPKRQNNNEFNLLFAGNIGVAQSVETIIDAAIILKNYPNIFIHIVGDGIELERIKEKAKNNNLNNVIFYGRKPLEEMTKYYNMSDAMIVTLINDEVLSLTLPGKVQTYMAAGKPIVGAINGETALLLNKVQNGFCGKAEDSSELANNILKLYKSNLACQIGARNREYYINTFSKEKFFEHLSQYINC